MANRLTKSAISTQVYDGDSPNGNFVVYASPGVSFAVGGSGTVYGTTSPDPVRIRDVPGTVVLDGTFNRGRDEVYLPGQAGLWGVVVVGSYARFSDGDTRVLVPLGSDAISVIFEDGVRYLRTDDGVAQIGEQVIDQTPAPVQANPVEYYLGIDTPRFGPTTVYVSPGAPVNIYSGSGPLQIFGTQDAEHLVLLGGKVDLDATFNRGGDKITLLSSLEHLLSLEDCTAEFAGSRVTLRKTEEGRYMELSIPVGREGIELEFDEGIRTLLYDDVAQQVRIGNQVISAEATALAAFG